MSGLRICRSCFCLYGESRNRRQLCSCAPYEEHDALAEARYAKDGTYWTRLAEICRCCGAKKLTTDHKFATWFCGTCMARVRKVNVACGRCAIPIGWHSIVNGVFLPSNRCKTPTGATSVADELGAFFRETSTMADWGKFIIERHWRDVGLPIDRDIRIDDYLGAVGAKGVDTDALFDELVAARGVPAHMIEGLRRHE